MDPEHRDYLRFLCIDDLAAEESRVVFGALASPFLLNAKIHYYMSSPAVDEVLGRKVLDSLYEDDFVGGGDDNISTYKLHENGKSCFKEGG